MIEVHRDKDDVAVFIGGEEVSTLDAGDDYVLAECDLCRPQRMSCLASVLPDDLGLCIYPQWRRCAFGSYIFSLSWSSSVEEIRDGVTV